MKKPPIPALALVLPLVFLLAACSAPKTTVAPVAAPVIIKEKVYMKPFDAVWQTAIEWFATHNTPIKNLDKTSGLISTEYSMSIGEAGKYMQCVQQGAKVGALTGFYTLDNYAGNFNVLIKKVNDNSTKVTVNVFFSCSQNLNKYVNALSTKTYLASSTRINCSSKGALEREILSFIEAAN